MISTFWGNKRDFYYHELVLLVKKKNKNKNKTKQKKKIIYKKNIFIERFLSYHDA